MSSLNKYSIQNQVVNLMIRILNHCFFNSRASESGSRTILLLEGVSLIGNVGGHIAKPVSAQEKNNNVKNSLSKINLISRLDNFFFPDFQISM